MKPVLNSKPAIQPGMRIKLIDGKNVDIGERRKPYDWHHGEIIEKIEGKIIHFKNSRTCNWFTVDMPWEIEE